jgi:MOSC domain-containing protein YiiM
MSHHGYVEHIHIAPAAAAPMQSVERVAAIAGHGLDGDRYAAGVGHWSSIRRRGEGLTLIEAEELAEVSATHVLDLPPGSTRRNLTTRGIRLESLLGLRFRIGAVTCRAIRRCEPCSYLDGLLGQSALDALVHRAGIRAEILIDGTIAVGDPIVVLPD